MSSSRQRTPRAFTLIEILIVVVILGILAAIVVPQFANASTMAVKAALARQLQMIDSNVSAYRASHADRFPTSDITIPMGEGGEHSGWGVLVSADYMKEAPRNPFTGQATLVAGTATTAAADVPASPNGWYYAIAPDRLDVFAAGFDRVNDKLSTEP